MNGKQIKALQLGQELNYIKLKQNSFPTITTPPHPTPTSSVAATDQHYQSQPRITLLLSLLLRLRVLHSITRP